MQFSSMRLSKIFRLAPQNLKYSGPMPHPTPHHGGSTLNLKKIRYLRRGIVLKIFDPHMKILTPYGFLNAYFLFSLPFYWFFMLIFPIFYGYQHIFMGGQTPLTPHLFSDGGSEIFFMGGQEVEMGGQIVFWPPWPPIWPPWGKTLPQLLRGKPWIRGSFAKTP